MSAVLGAPYLESITEGMSLLIVDWNWTCLSLGELSRDCFIGMGAMEERMSFMSVGRGMMMAGVCRGIAASAFIPRD